MNKPEIEKLAAQALKGNYSDDAPWDAVNKLREIGSREVLELAMDWCKSPTALIRARGADILAQIGQTIEHSSNMFPQESFNAVAQLLAKETEIQPLASSIAALGHIGNVAAVPLVIPYVTHADSEVRFAVAHALGSFPDETASVTHLLQLISDADDDVRDWAAFGLGNMGSADSPAIRDALALRLNDTFEDVRMEAMIGLAKRKDKRVVQVVLQQLKQPEVQAGAIEAACLLLGMEEDNEEWEGADYAAAIRKKSF